MAPKDWQTGVVIPTHKNKDRTIGGNAIASGASFPMSFLEKGMPDALEKDTEVYNWFILSLPRPDPCGFEHLIHRERPVATQHSLRNCVDHLAALSHIGYTIRCKFGLLYSVEV